MAEDVRKRGKRVQRIYERLKEGDREKPHPMPNLSDEEAEKAARFLDHLLDNPMPITQARYWARDELDLSTHLARKLIVAWSDRGEIGDEREEADGPGRPPRVVGGEP